MGKQKNTPHKFPEVLLHQIFEHVGGGFILFGINKEGEPEVFQQFDNEIIAMGLLNYVRHFSESIEAIHSNNIFGSMVGNDEDSEDVEEEYLPPEEDEN